MNWIAATPHFAPHKNLMLIRLIDDCGSRAWHAQ